MCLHAWLGYSASASSIVHIVPRTGIYTARAQLRRAPHDQVPLGMRRLDDYGLLEWPIYLWCERGHGDTGRAPEYEPY